MNIKNIFYSVLLILVFCMSSLAFALDKIDADDFIEEITAKNIAEMDSATLAFEKSTSTDIKSYAHTMIADHSATNIQLADIANRKGLKVSNEAELTAKAKKFIMKQRDGQSFDEAYANSQVESHKDAIELFQRVSISTDVEIATFAKQTLPTLQHRLQLAKELAAVHDDK